MGKAIEKVKLTSLFDPTKSVEVEAVIDTGATMLVLPQNIVEGLNPRKMREVKVRYAINKAEVKPIYGAATVEIQGRAGEFNVLEEPGGSQPLVGQIVLEQLDLVVQPGTRKVVPNPRSPEMPMVEILSLMAPPSFPRPPRPARRHDLNGHCHGNVGAVAIGDRNPALRAKLPS